MQENIINLLDLGAIISLIRYSTYQTIDSSFKTPIQATTTKLNTADGSPMTAFGITALYLRIVDFKLTHNFIVWNRPPDTEILFVIDIQKKNFPVICLGQGKEPLHTEGDRFLPYTRNCEQKATIGIV